ncbi:hypothetical protein EZY14_014230 [Kordia sp. TARA_039_SRF]|nr:hypothetical protein EZY14_014230 [Kordia sp. TARA_039_SRF]
MLKSILLLKGVSLLSKKQQGNIIAGSNICRITIIYPDGGRDSVNVYISGSSGQEISQGANNFCLSEIYNEGVSRCFYDCEYDGFGQ